MHALERLFPPRNRFRLNEDFLERRGAFGNHRDLAACPTTVIFLYPSCAGLTRLDPRIHRTARWRSQPLSKFRSVDQQLPTVRTNRSNLLIFGVRFVSPAFPIRPRSDKRRRAMLAQTIASIWP